MLSGERFGVRRESLAKLTSFRVPIKKVDDMHLGPLERGYSYRSLSRSSIQVRPDQAAKESQPLFSSDTDHSHSLPICHRYPATVTAVLLLFS